MKSPATVQVKNEFLFYSFEKGLPVLSRYLTIIDKARYSFEDIIYIYLYSKAEKLADNIELTA
jgi:hypothetical protein